MHPRTALALTALAVVAASACSDDPAPPQRAPLAPRFAPDVSTTSAPAAATPPAAGRAADGAPATSAAPPPPGAPAAAPGAVAPVLEATASDPHGDVTPAVGEAVPAWADLAGATLRREPDAFELRITFAGAAPDRAPDADHTMNVAAFFDVDGDGTIDYEVWANLATGGWGGAWYDDTNGTARFVDDSEVGVAVAGGALVLRFPLGHVGGASAFRWSLASEWGRHAVIGTVAAARDDAPDEDGSVTFPG